MRGGPTDPTLSHHPSADTTREEPDTPAPRDARVDTLPESGAGTSAAVFANLPVVPRERYPVVRELAEGGIGKISIARDVRLGRDVAIKELRAGARYAKERFAREIVIGAKLEHPSIVPVHEAGRWPNGEPFFAMKLVHGKSLEAAIGAAVERASRMQLLRHVSDVAEAIAYAHSQGIVHRDLKPANVLLGPFGETVVIDWGLAKDLNANDPTDEPVAPLESGPTPRYKTTDGVVVGTPAYMAPEQAAGQRVDARSDVYAIGAILYHLLSGRAPYDDSYARNLLAKVLASPPTPLDELEPDLPRDLLALVRKAMARDPKDRYPSAAEMAEELARFIAGGLVGAYRYSLGERLLRFVRRNRAAVATALLALVLLSALGALSIVRIAEQRDRAEQERERAELSAIAESKMRDQAERRLDEAVLEAARAALSQDPTLALARLKRLDRPLPGAASVASDAVERGAASHVLAGHDDQVEALAWSADGRYLASAGRDGRIQVWDKREDALRVLSGHGDRVPAIAFAPKAKLLASAGYDGRVLLWELPSGKKRALLEGKAAVRALAFDEQGKELAAVADDGVRVWKVAGGEAVRFEAHADRPLFALFTDGGLVTGSHEHALISWDLAKRRGSPLDARQGEIRDLARSRDGLLASAGQDGTVVVWRDGRADRTLRGHRGSVEAVAFAPDGTLLSGGSDGSVRSWSGKDGDLLAQHAERVADLVVSPDGRTVASAGWDKTIAIYDRASRTLRKLIGHRDVVSALAFAPDGRSLASASWDQEVRIWPMVQDGRRALRGHTVGVKAVGFDPSSRLLASGGHDDTVRLWRTDTGELVRTFEGHSDHVFRVRFSPDGQLIASSSDDRSVRIWSVKDDHHRSFDGHRADVEEIAFSKDNKRLASGGEDGAVGLWRLDDDGGRLLEGHKGAVTSIAFAPAGKLLASASRDRTIRLWDARTGKDRGVLGGHRGEVTSIVFLQSGELISAASDDSVWIWNTKDKSRRALGRSLRGAWQLAVAPDDRTVAVAGMRSDVWLCPLSRESCRALGGHAARVHALAFSPDSRLLVTAGADGIVRLCDVETFECHPMRGHTAPIFDVAFAPNGKTLASASADATVRLWPLVPPPPPQELATFLKHTTTLVAPAPR
jgi:WD40 repeat protein